MKRSTEVSVGVVVILGALLVVFGTIWLKGIKPGREQMQLTARFAQVGQLLDGATVKLRGVPIGRVESIELEEGGTGVLVTMSIRSDVHLPDDAVVVLSPESMFGDWQAEIGERSSPYYQGYSFAEALGSGQLPGYALPDISKLTAVADQIASDLAVLADRFQQAFTEETADNVRQAIENIQEVSSQLTGLITKQQAAFDEVAASLSATSDAATQAAARLDRTFSQVESAIGEGRLTGIMGNVQVVTARADSLTMELMTASRDLRRMASGADTTLRHLGAIATRVEQGEGSLGRLLQDSSLYYTLSESSLQLQALLRDIREHPRKYINLTIF